MMRFSYQLYHSSSTVPVSRSLASRFLTKLFSVDNESKRHGGELVASVLKSHGVQEIFTLCGGHISPILVSCEKLGIKVYDTRHEVTCVFAADAVARLRQSIGVAAVTSGPGVTNTITAVKNAQLAESPVLLIGGAAPTLLKGRGALQDIDQMSIVQSLCKFTERIKRVKDIVPVLRQAIFEAKSGRPGPVFVEFPLDVLQPYQTALKEASISKTNGQFKKKLLHFYQQAYTDWMFSKAFSDSQDVTPLHIKIPQPTPSDARKIADLILQAKRPLLLLGSQATLPPTDPASLVAAVKKLAIPTFLGGMSRGLLGADSNLQIRHERSSAIRDADLIILGGAVCDFRLKYGKAFQPGTKIISINRCPQQMLKNHGTLWKCAAAVNADVGLTLVAVQKYLQGRTADQWKGGSDEWMKALHDRDETKENFIKKKMEEEPKDGHMNPLKSLSIIQDSLPKDSILVADGGDYVGTAAYIIKPGGPLQWLDPGAFGTLGVGGGFALGAKAVYPERPVAIIYGDGALGYSLIEFDTFVRHGLPVIGIVGNDACWTQIAREQVPLFQSEVACNLNFTKYDEAARALGTNGATISRHSEVNRFKEVLKEAVEKCRPPNGQSTMINVLIGKTDFREGSISV